VSADTRGRGKLLEAWEPPVDAGDPVGVVASTFTFDAGFFEEELLARFLAMETSVDDGRPYLVEREERLGRALAVVLADRRHVSRSTTLAWDLLPVPVPRGASQHAKVAVLAWEKLIRVVIGSANLTKPAYRSNVECFAHFDFHADGVVPRAFLTDTLAFLRRMTEAVPDPEGDDSPRQRALGLLRSIRRLARRLQLPASPPKNVVVPVPVFLEPERGDGVLTQMGDHWGGPAGPNEVWLMAPFWTEAAAGAPDALLDAVVAQMGPRGDREVVLLAPGEELQEEGWCIQLPVGYEEAELPRVDVGFNPIPAQQGDNQRPLHAKGIWWGRFVGKECRREALLIGSSNMTQSGLGLGGAPRNYEANVLYVTRKDKAAARWFDAAWPHYEAPDEVRAIGGAGAAADEGTGVPPVPVFFGWAALQGQSVRVGLGDGDEPPEWTLAVDGTPVRYERARYHEEDRPAVVTLPLPAGDGAPPTLVRVVWHTDEARYEGVLPINALGNAERSRPGLWGDIDIDTLLDLLASGGSTWRALAKALRRQNKEGARRLPADTDPHGKVDTSRFLVQRMRRISRALDGLHERLARPVHSRASLAWRFDGPLAPARLAALLCESVADFEEQRFLLAELALTVRRAQRKATAPGLKRAAVDAAFDAAVQALRAMVEGDADSPLLRKYLDRVFAGEAAS
jgi:hypothetical protein